MRRVDIVSTSILLLIVFSRQVITEDPAVETTVAETTEADVPTPPPIPTAPPIPSPPTPGQPIVPSFPTTEAPNPNITQIDEIQIRGFLTSGNGHRQQHMMGKYAYVWTWDQTLVESATTRILPSCNPKIDNSDEIREILFTFDDWFKIRRDKKTLHQKMITVTYEKGNARVGCIRRNGCGGGSKETDQVFFCHFAPALYSPDKDFNKPAVDCQYDETFSNLCIDVPIRNSTTEAPVRIVYVKSSNGLQFIIVFAIILVARMI